LICHLFAELGDSANGLNQKTILFAGSTDHGDNWAVITTLNKRCNPDGSNAHV